MQDLRVLFLLLAALVILVAGACSGEGDDDVAGDDDTATTDDDTGDDDAADDDVADDDTADDDDDTEPVSGCEGNDYYLDLGEATFTEPPGIGSLIGQYLSDVHLVTHITALAEAANSAELFMTAVDKQGSDYVQDMCVETISLTDGSYWDNPFMEVTFDQLPLVIEGIECSVSDMRITWNFRPGCGELANGTLGGELDTRCLDSLIDPGAPEGAACDLVSSLGIECLECTSGVGPFCLVIAAEDIGADSVDVTAIDPETGTQYDDLTEVTAEMLDAWTTAGDCP